MANNMNFNATLRLTTDQFKKGVADVKKSLDGLKRSFLGVAGALGAGLGLGQLLSNLKNTAVQLSVAKNTLENVSNVTKEWTDGVNKGTVQIKNYGENLAFVRKMASDYSQDLVALMQNFAQFHAACEKTNLDLENQKLVFEALTKAAAYYHMSADRTKDMMNAVTQMMSKGKVAAEELRRQLGNALPGAFNLMAAALGVSNAQLDDMMRKGQVISSEALPRFAAMLNTVTEAADFNSLQMSLNRLKNTWYDFTERMGAEDIFNNIVNKANSALSYISNNIKELKSLLLGFVAAIGSYKLFASWKRQGEEYIKESNAQLKKLEAQYNRWIKSYNKSLTGRPNATTQSISIDSSTKVATGQLGAMDVKTLENLRNYNNTVMQIAQNRRSLLPIYSQEWQVQNKIVQEAKAQVTQADKLLIATKGNIASTNLLKTAYAGLVSLGKTLVATLKSMGIMAIISAVIGGVTAIASYIKKIADEQKRVNNLFGDFINDVRSSSRAVAENGLLLQKNLSIMQDEKNNIIARKNALAEINKMMGTSYNLDALDKTKKAYKDIVAEVERWIKATKTQALVQVFAQKAAEAQIEIDKINIRQDQLKKEREKLSKGLLTGIKLGKIEIEESINKKALEEYGAILNYANSQMDMLQVKWLELQKDGPGGGGGGETDISKVFKKYNDDLKELDNKLREHAITQEQYNEEFDKLVTKYSENAAATGALSIDKIIKKMDKGETLTKLEKWYKDLADAAKEAAKRALLNSAAEDMTKDLIDEVEESIKAAEEAAQKQLEKDIKTEDANLYAMLLDMPGTMGGAVMDKRSPLFDYSKSGSDVLEEQAEEARSNAKKIEDILKDLDERFKDTWGETEEVSAKIDELRAKMHLLKTEASTLEAAMMYQKITEDLEALEKELNKTIGGGIKNAAESSFRLIKSIKALKETLEDTNADEWEKFAAIFSEVMQIIDTVVGIAQTFQSIMTLTTKIEAAQIAQEQALVELQKQKVALERELYIWKQKNAGKSDEEIAKGLLGVGATVAAGMLTGGADGGILASLLKSVIGFSKGGIVGGNSYSGDRMLARVNSGEAVLTKGQQATLFNMLNGKGGVGGPVDFRIRGTDLIGVIQNEQRKRRG